VTSISASPFERSEQDRVIAGVCGGLASTLGVDATLVRLAFALLALAGGAGILLYFALWTYSENGSPRWAIALAALALLALLVAFGLSGAALLGTGLILAGAAVAASRGASLRPGGSLPVPAIALTTIGAVVLLDHLGASRSFVGPGALVGALLLLLGPWVWQLVGERAERIRMAERAEIAARVHDSVLQTLALIQRDAGDPVRVAAIARRQERELRRWLYGTGVDGATTLEDALADAAADVEELHGVRVELASSGRMPLDERVEQLVLAAREAMTNAAKFSGAPEISVYAAVDGDTVSVFVHDRGRGFERAAVPADRRGIAESIEGRMRRAGGTATITSVPGQGTEVELTLGGQS
jgi:signal transduction histidine kinase